MERHVLPILRVCSPQSLDEMQKIRTEIVADTFVLLLPLVLVEQHYPLQGTNNIWGTGGSPTPKRLTFENRQPPSNFASVVKADLFGELEHIAIQTTVDASFARIRGNIYRIATIRCPNAIELHQTCPQPLQIGKVRLVILVVA